MENILCFNQSITKCFEWMIIMKKVCILLIIFFIFTGCTKDLQQPATLSTPKTQPYTAASKDVIVLSYPDEKLSKLTRITLEMPRNSNISLAQSTAYSLLSGEGSAGYYVPFNAKAYPLKVEVSRNLIEINIGGDFSELSEKEFFSSIVSLTNTLTGLKNIDYVKLAINNLDFVPTGVFTNPLTYQNENLYLLFLEHQDYLNNETEQKPETTPSYLLYFMDFSGKYLLTEIRRSFQSNDDIIIDLFNELKNGPAASNEMKSPIPKNVVMQKEPQIHEDETFGNIITLSLEAPKHETIDNEARFMLAAAVVNTIQSNVPDIKGVRILINSQPIISTSIMTKLDFTGILGNIVTLYFPNNDATSLIRVKRAMSQDDYKLASARMKELILGVAENETDSAVSVVPEQVTEDDLLSFHMNADTLYLNISQHFADSCNFGPADEMMLVYSIVNTLTEFNNIKKVQILVEGEIVETLCGYMALDQPLLPNPGIIQK